MTSRRSFLQNSLILGAASLFTGTLAGCGVTPSRSFSPSQPAVPQPKPQRPPPDLFDAAILNKDFWLQPRTLSVYRSATGESAKVLYWKDGEIQQRAYRRLCHMLRDVNGRASMDMDPELLEILWATQAFVDRFGVTSPIEILSGYRTPASNRRLQEKGIPAARKSLHLQGKAADIRIKGLDAGVLGNLVKSFRQGGVGFYYRKTATGGWIHVDSGLRRTWKG
jgi:uncharacterized protein YcbK (DUF882 family)